MEVLARAERPLHFVSSPPPSLIRKSSWHRGPDEMAIRPEKAPMRWLVHSLLSQPASQIQPRSLPPHLISRIHWPMSCGEQSELGLDNSGFVLVIALGAGTKDIC